MRLPWPQVKEESREPKPYERTPPNQMPGVDALDIEHIERDERRDRQHAESHRERVDNRHIPRRVAGSKEEHHAQHKRKTAHLLQREEKQSRDIRLRRMQEQAGDEWLAAED